MGKQQSQIKSLDYFPDIKNVVVPDDVKRVMQQQGRNPLEWESKLNAKIAEGGQTKADAVKIAFGLFDKIQSGDRYGRMIQDADAARANRRADTNDRRAGREQRAISADSITPPNADPTQQLVSTDREIPVAEDSPERLDNATNPIVDVNANSLVKDATIQKTNKPVEQVSAWQAFFGSLHNAVVNIGEGVFDFANDANTAAVRLSGAVPWASEADKKYAEDYEKIGEARRGAIDKAADFMSVYIDPESSKSPVSMKTNKDGKLDVDFTAMSDPKKWAAGTGGAIGSLVPSLLAGGGAASFATSFFGMYSQNQDDAIAAGLKGNEVLSYATGTSTAGAVLELIGTAGILNGFKEQAGKQIIKEIVKDKSAAALNRVAQKGITADIFDDSLGMTFREGISDLKNKSLMKYYGKIAGSWIKDKARLAAPEAATEFVQEWSDYGSKRLWNGTVGLDRPEGQGSFSTDVWETTGNSIFGGFMGGFLGASVGSIHSNSNPKELHETLGAYVNADIKDQLAKNPNSTFEEIIQNSKFGKVIDAARKNGQFSNPDGTVNEQKITDLNTKSLGIYQTFFDLKDVPNLKAADKTAMFHITNFRNENQQALNEFTGIKDQISQINAEITAAPTFNDLIRLEAQRSSLENQLGEKDPATGEYLREKSITDEAQRMDAVFSQAIPEITKPDPESKAMGRSFLQSNIAAFRSPGFKAETEVTTTSGMMVVRDGTSTAIRQVITTPVQPDGSMSDQMAKGKYEPITRFEKRYEPIETFAEYSEAAALIAQKADSALTDAAKSPYQYSADAAELIADLSTQAQVLQVNPDIYNQVREQAEKGYDMYNQIVAVDSKSSSPSLVPMTQEEFNGAIGFELIPEAEPEVQDDSQPAVEPIPMETMEGQRVVYNGQQGVLKKDGVRYVVETENSIYELAESGDAADINEYGIKPYVKPDAKYNVEVLGESKVSVNGVSYTINNDENGSVESLSPDNNPGQKITNEAMMVAVEIGRSKADFNNILENTEGVNQAYDALTQPPNFEGILLDGIFAKNFNESVETALNKLENGEELSDSERLALDLWSTDAYMEIESMRERLPESEIFQNASDYFEMVNVKLNPDGQEIQSQEQSGVQNSDSDGSSTSKTVRESGKKTPRTTKSKLDKSNGETSQNTPDESADTAGDISSSGEPRSVKSEYARTAAVQGPLESATEQTEGIQSELGSAQSAVEAAIENGEVEDIAGALESVERALDAIEQGNGQAEELLGKIDELVDETPGDSDSSTQDETIPGQEQEVRVVKRKGIPKSKRQIKEPDRIKALAKVPNDIYEEVYQFFVSNMQLETQSVADFFGKADQKKEGKSNQERKEMISSTAGKDKGGMTFDEAAHYLWENTNFGERFETSDYKNALEEVVQSYPGIKELTRRLNNDAEQSIDNTVDPSSSSTDINSEPEVIPENLINETNSTFAENLAKSEEDPDYVPFSEDNNNAPISENETLSVLDRLSKAFPNILVNIPQDIDSYLDALNNATNPQTIYTKDNLPYGFIDPISGGIFLDPSRLNTNTAIHEFGHIWTMWAKNNNPELYQKGIDLIKDSQYYRRLANNPAYSSRSRAELLDEALATAIGNRGETFQVKHRRSDFQNWMDGVFKAVKDFFGIKSTPKEIADMNLKDFTKKVVADLTSGEQLSALTSKEIAQIMADNKPKIQESVAEMGTDPLLHAMPATFGATGSGETIGTFEEHKQAVIDELTKSGIYGKTTQKLTDIDKREIAALADRHGWMYRGQEMIDDPANPGMKIPHQKWTNDISSQKNSFLLPNGKSVYIPLMGLAGKEGRVASAISETEIWLNDIRVNGSLIFKTGKALIDSSLDGLGNIETFVKAIDSSDRILHTIIHNVKRAAANNRNDAMNIMGSHYEEFRRTMGKWTMHKGTNTLESVEKKQFKMLQWDRRSGKAVERILHAPVSVLMDIVAKHQSQIAMGEAYNTREVTDNKGNKRIEIHSSFVVDSHYETDPTDVSLFYKTQEGLENIHKGVHLKRDVLMEANAKGELELLADGKQFGLFTQAEMDNLVDYFTASGPKEIRENFQKIKEAFNDSSVREKLQKENDESINPAEAFVSVADYAPIQTVNSVSAQDKVNSFAPNLEDSKQLNVRTGRPDSVYGEDIIDSFDYYKESVGHILGSTKLVHNLKNLQQAIISDYDGVLKDRLLSTLSKTIENLQNYRQSQWKVSKWETALRPLGYLMSRYTGFTFRLNLGISTKQIGTWFSAYGLGYIDDKYMYWKQGDGNKHAFLNMINMAFMGSTKDRLAGGTIVEKTGQGMKGVFGETAEAEFIRDLTGANIIDPVAKAEHRKLWATVIQRVVYGQSQYTEAADFGKLKFTRAGAAGIKQGLNKSDQFFEEYGMTNIRKLDRAVILGYMIAAKNQVADEVSSGKTKAANANARAAQLTTDTLYLTNQMSDPTDLTMMQRNQTFGMRMLSAYSGQTQKLWNQMAGSAIEYYKHKDTAPEKELAIMKKRMRSTLISNLVMNTMWMASANTAATVLRGFINGDEPKEDGFYAKKFGFDVARYITSVAPGISAQVMNFIISKVDNEKWSDEIFDIPGSSLANNAVDGSTDLVKLMASPLTEDEEDEEKLVTGAIYNLSKVIGVVGGIPKVIIDPISKRINSQIKTPKGLTTKDIQWDQDESTIEWTDDASEEVDWSD